MELSGFHNFSEFAILVTLADLYSGEDLSKDILKEVIAKCHEIYLFFFMESVEKVINGLEVKVETVAINAMHFWSSPTEQ